MNNPIVSFLAERKKLRLKKPGNRTDEEIEEEFRIVNWVGNAAHRAGQLSIVTHPGKFSHPDAKISPLIAIASNEPDGYLRTGNATAPNDVLGNAAALDVFAFLSLLLDDGKTILDHIERNTVELRELLDVDHAIFEGWRNDFLKIKSTDSNLKTDGRVKQVYFPVSTTTSESGYHLLSILTPSGLITENRNRIREMKFSDQAKVARAAKKDGKHDEHGVDDIWNILKVKYGGTQPQNISRLNSQNAGEAWLLPSNPPAFSPDHIRVPQRDFFSELRFDDRLRMIYRSVHTLFRTDYNNVRIRDARKHWFESIFDWCFERVWTLQQHTPGWSDQGSVQIPMPQKLWLDSDYFEKRDSYDDWENKIVRAFAQWTIITYRKMRKQAGDAVELGHVEESAFDKELKDYIRQLKGELS